MEDEIKVNDFVRTNRGIILKVVKIEFDKEANQNYYMGEEICSGCFQEMVKIHSPNIIDLIEERRLCKWTRNSLCF